MKLHNLVQKLDNATQCPFINKCADGFYGSAEECMSQEYAMCKHFYIHLQDTLKNMEAEHD